MEDAALVAGLRSGDPRAFDATVVRYSQRLWAFLLRLCGRQELAEELLQETFVRLASHGRSLREDTRLSAWLFTVARNLARSHRRWAWLDGQRLAELAVRAILRSAPEPTPLERYAETETAQKLERALASMPPSSREVAILVWVEQMSPSDAATVLGIKPEAARQRLARARQWMDKELGGAA
jgi:RNA polymerase sigma-70 factor (ECF subfamily)